MKFLKSLSIYTISNMSQKAIGFVLLPIITGYLSTKENGSLSIIMTIVSTFGPLLLLSTHGAINVEYFRQDHGKDNYNTYFTSALVNPLLMFLGFYILIFFFGEWTADKLALGLSRDWILMIPILCFATLLPQILSVVYQFKNKPLQYAAFNIGLTATDLVLSILLIVVLEMTWEGRVWGKYGAMLFFSVLALIILYRKGYINFSIKKEYIRDAFLFGLPLIPHVLSSSVLDLSDRLFINKMVGKEELGIYDIGYKVGSIILILQSSVMLAWGPYVYEKLKNITQVQKVHLVKVSYAIVGGLFLCALLLHLVSPLIFKIAVQNEAYLPALQYVGIIALSYAFLGCYKMFSLYIIYLKRNIWLSYIAIFNILLNLTLNYFFIKNYGVMGAAYATLASYFLFFVITAAVSQYLYPMPWLFFWKKK